MYKFAPGDKVRVIATDGFEVDKFPIGRVLTIRDIAYNNSARGPCLRFHETSGGPYGGPYADKFELVDPSGHLTEVLDQGAEEYEQIMAAQEIIAGLS